MASACSQPHVHYNVGGPMLNKVFQAACDGDLPIFKALVVMLDMGRGCPKEAIEALRVEDAGELEGFTALHAAAKGGGLDVCKYLVEELLVDVDVVDKKGRTPLFFAIHSNDVGTAKYLLNHGANQDKVNHDGLSLLHSAALSDNCQMVELLLAKGAYVDPVADCGTPLHFAASEGRYGTMKILLDYNADYNKMVNGETPLIAATCADSKSMECIMLLVKAGADLKGALAYAAKILHEGKVVSSNFFKCMMEDAGADHDVCIDDEPMVKREIRTGGLMSLGIDSLRKKDYRLAAGFFSQALDLDPGDAILLSNRSLCWLQMGAGDKALRDANKCRKIRPDWPISCYRQGAALMLLKDYEGASERFLDGLKLDPVNAEIEDALREAMKSLKTSRSSKAKQLFGCCREISGRL
ncbi:ankyrin-2-like [Lolium rigidum]|uniref:ankyrin-2-like n=1 Tax=Lolium rigidum TaxID=89674 RepID=UPI001F5D24C9|nr:ankyrin-2-like [Lolium rigidum]